MSGGAGSMRVALVSEVFFDETGDQRLAELLAAARAGGAQLALLPEISHLPWAPATRTADPADAEPPGGARERRVAALARRHGIGVVAGWIVRDPETGKRENQAIVFDAAGELRGRYAKLHLPEEPGFWETDHYAAGALAPRPIAGFPLAFGLQICSDNNRPEGTHLLAAAGAHAVFAPRATERRTFARWRTVFQANAMTSACYVLSVNRPRPEGGVALGGPSIAVAPDGTVLLESEETLALVDLAAAAVAAARVDYPGYLPVRSALYARAWAVIPEDAGYAKDPEGRPPSTLPGAEPER